MALVFIIRDITASTSYASLNLNKALQQVWVFLPLLIPMRGLDDHEPSAQARY